MGIFYRIVVRVDAFLRCIIFLALLSGCGGQHYIITTELDVDPSVIKKLNSLYDPAREKAMCVSKSEVSNIIIGGCMGVELPLCKRNENVMHTHPIGAEGFANFIDLHSWDIYHAVFGNTTFSIMLGKNRWIVYSRRKEFVGKTISATVEEVKRIKEELIRKYNEMIRFRGLSGV